MDHELFPAPWVENDNGGIEDAEGTEVAKATVKIRNLIIASPELLDALEYFLECSPCCNGCDPSDMSCASSRARAIINKANKGA